MLEDLCRAILTKDNKKYEFVTFDADLPSEAQYQELKDNHKFDFCVKQTFKSYGASSSFSTLIFGVSKQ